MADVSKRVTKFPLEIRLTKRLGRRVVASMEWCTGPRVVCVGKQTMKQVWGGEDFENRPECAYHQCKWAQHCCHTTPSARTWKIHPNTASEWVHS